MLSIEISPEDFYLCSEDMERGNAYLFLTTDLFSRKILGFHLSKDLSHHSALLALSMALKQIPNPAGIIHHSDRGCQYCCHEFINYLKYHQMLPSMTAQAHFYENANAERINGILKLEFNFDSIFLNFSEAKIFIENNISIYNSKRRHWSLQLQTPQSVYSKAP